MANTIQHVCIYCRRRFRGKSSRYMSHIRKHRQWFHKYRFHQWRLYFGQGKNKYSTGQKKKKWCRQKRRNRVKSSHTQHGGSADGIIAINPGPSTDDASAISCHRNEAHRNSDGLPSMVDSARHTPSKNEKKHYKCAFCEKTFAGGSHLLLHERTHTGEKPHACRFCPKSFAQKGYLKIHERIHTGERPFKCTFCGKAFCTKEDLRRHERIHTGEKPYKCKVCARGFSQRSYRNKHEAIHSGDRPFASKPAIVELQTPSPDFDVSQLPDLPPALLNAIQAAGLIGTKVMTPDIIDKLKSMPEDQQREFIDGLSIMTKKTKYYDYLCRFCGCDCHSLSQLRQHERTHFPDLPPALLDMIQVAGLIGTKELTPDIVEKLISMPEEQQQELIDGLSVMKRKQRSFYLCKFCGRDCRSSSQLRQHERTHTGEKPFQCRFCEKSFAQKGYARIHERIHTGERPFQCDVCSKAFAAKEDLRRHLRTHTGEKPYKCEVCGKAFSQNSALIGHRKTHLNELTNLDYTSHSFVGSSIFSSSEQQSKPDFANYLGSDFYKSAKVMQMLAGEARGVLSNPTHPADKDERKADIMDNFDRELASGMPPKHMTDFMSRSVSSNSMANSLPFLPGLSSPCVNGGTATDTMDTVIKKGIHDIASKLLVSRYEEPNSNLQIQQNQVESSTLQSFVTEKEEEDQVDEGISIVDHIRMQLSLPTEDPKDQTEETKIETSHKEDQADFDKKKKKINNLASQLSSKVSKNNGFKIIDSDVFNKANTVDDVAAHLLAMKTSQDPTFQLDDSLTTSKNDALRPADGHIFNKKMKINDLATQLLSTQLAQHKYNNQTESDHFGKKDPVFKTSVISDEAQEQVFSSCDMSSNVPQNDSIYHRAAQLLQPKLLRFSRSDGDEDASDNETEETPSEDSSHCVPLLSDTNVSCADKEQLDNNFGSKKRNINGLASHLANLSKKRHTDSNESFKSNTIPSEIPPNSIQYLNLDRNSLCPKKSINSIAAQLITTKASQDESDLHRAVSNSSLEEEMLQRKQQGVSNNNIMCSKSIKPSITSIFRPLQEM